MKRVFPLAVAALLLAPAPSHAQSVLDLLIGCGEVRGVNSAAQYGNFGLWLEYIVSTNRTINTCPLTVAVQARVVQVEHSAASDQGVFSATARRQVPVLYPGVWQTNGEHQVIVWVYFPGIAPTTFLFELTPTKSLADIRNQRTREDFCYEMGGEWDGWTCYVANSPLIVDTEHDGYELTNVAEGVPFDLDADGRLDRVAWTAADSDDAFLVMDRNGNGRIDDGTELFGNYTPAYNDNRRDITTANGFDALKFLETASYGNSEPDGVIDARDAPFSRLMLWRDRNHNGISEPDELERLTASGLRAIQTDYQTSSRKDRHGNEFRQRAKGVFADGDFFIYDVWLKRQ